MRKFLFLILFLILIFSLIFITEAKAGTGDNVSGWAWSENIGWISFNNTTGGGTTNYGVNINPSTGVFSGYAWSENIGWITFNESELSGCPSGTCQAKLDFGTKQVSGWAKALTDGGGWDGWIKLRGTAQDGSPYGVFITSKPDPQPDEFEGWVWGFDVVGWISFNCSNRGVCTAATAEGGPSDYKVITTLSLNQPPYVQPGSATVTGEDYCLASPTGQVSIKWTYQDDDGDNQSQYNFQVATDSTFTTIILDYTASQTVSPGGTGTSAIRVVPAPTVGQPEIAYPGVTSTRYWQVRVQAATGNLAWSGWEAGPSFIIPAHAYPTIDFTWSPQSPSADEIVSFFNETDFYDAVCSLNPDDPSCSYSWTFQDGDPATSILRNPQTKFTSTGLKEVILTAIDSDGFSCTASSLNMTPPGVQVSLPLPEWREISPF